MRLDVSRTPLPLRFRAALLLVGAVLIAAGTFTASASANHSVLRLVSVDPPGSTVPRQVLGPNMSNITPGIALTPDGRTAVYRTSDGLYKSSDGRTELVGVGPRGLAHGVGCLGEHDDCHHMVSRDGKRVAFETPSPLIDADADSCGDPGLCIDVYERVGADTTLLSFQDQDGGSTPFDSFFLESMSLDGTRVFIRRTTGYRIPVGTWEHVNGALFPFPSPANQASWATIHREGASADGRRVLFTTADSLVPEDTDDCIVNYGGSVHEGCADLYERTRDGAVRLVSTGLGLANEPFDAYFDGASEDGRRVFFTTREKLVPEDTDQCLNGAGNPWGCTDVYERSNGVTRLISVGPAGGAAAVEAKFGAVSADGTRVFFLTDEPLVPEDTDSCPDSLLGPGCVDIYELRGEVLRLVSTGPTGNRDGFDVRLSGISKDGSHVFFETWGPLVPTDTDNQVDVYDRTSGVTRLVSTGPNSPNGDYNAFFNGSSEDGERVFFTTGEPLLPEDNDCTAREYPGDVGCPDVYERYGGVTSLLTRGTVECVNTDFGFEPLCPEFVGASKDGRRVFFVTQESLVPEDTDALNDLYVATVPSRACRPDKPGKRPKKCGF